MISAVSMPCRYVLVTPRCACWTELTLDDRERHSFAGHFDSVGVAELMRREAPAHPRDRRESSQLSAGAGL